MEQQAGTYKVRLIENKDVTVSYHDKNTISGISSSGETIEIVNDGCGTSNISAEIMHSRTANNKLRSKIKLEWRSINLSSDNVAIVNKLKASIYGWLPIIEGYNSDITMSLNPLKFDVSSTESVSNDYAITLMPREYSNQLYYYIAGVWILAEGIWNDEGIWVDTEFWIDGV